MTHRILLDCDPGVDDAVALLLACGSPELELLAVTTVAGNRPLDVTTRNAGRLLALAGADVPVHAGCARPLAQAEPRCNLVHGEDGLGGAALPEGRAPAEGHACDVIVRTLREAAPGTVTLVAVGPLTNLAAVEILHPGVLRRARQLLVMGGAAFVPGNVTPAAEFNFHADPLAAHTVLTAGAPLRLFGLDVTRQAVMTADWIDGFGAFGTRCGRAVHDMLRAYAAWESPMHDPCPVAALLDATLFESEPATVTVDWRPGPTEGHCVAWRVRGRDVPSPPNVELVTGVDAARLRALVRERIARLP